MLSTASCSLSACGSLKLKMTLVLISAIEPVYPGPVFKFPARNLFCRILNLSPVFMADGCEFENLLFA